MRFIITILTFAAFLVYSQSMLVMWCLYFIEKHDIILYYCPEDADGRGDGSSYVHRLCDASKGEHEGARAMLKIIGTQKSYDRTYTLTPTPELPPSFLCDEDDSPRLYSAYALSVFRPPRS